MVIYQLMCLPTKTTQCLGLTISVSYTHLDVYKRQANIEATGVKLLGDSVGLIKIIGSYDDANKLVLLDKSSGVCNSKFSVVTEGEISLDPKSTEQLDGNIKIANFPLKFIEPFIKGYASKLGGTIDGEVGIKGSLKNPVFDGGLSLINVLARVDYTGCLLYTSRCV